jgi:hypothetical protein
MRGETMSRGSKWQGAKGTTDFLRHIARARKRGWVQEEYPEGNGIKLTRTREVTTRVGAVGGGQRHTERRTLYVIFFENTIAGYRIREDLDPTVRAPKAIIATRARAVEYLEEFGEDPESGWVS